MARGCGAELHGWRRIRFCFLGGGLAGFLAAVEAEEDKGEEDDKGDEAANGAACNDADIGFGGAGGRGGGCGWDGAGGFAGGVRGLEGEVDGEVAVVPFRWCCYGCSTRRSVSHEPSVP